MLKNGFLDRCHLYLKGTHLSSRVVFKEDGEVRGRKRLKGNEGKGEDNTPRDRARKQQQWAALSASDQGCPPITHFSSPPPAPPPQHPSLPSLLLLCSDTEHSAHLGARKNFQGNNDDGILTEKKKIIWRSLALCGRSHKTGSDLQAVNCVSLGTVALLPGNLPGRS